MCIDVARVCCGLGEVHIYAYRSIYRRTLSGLMLLQRGADFFVKLSVVRLLSLPGTSTFFFFFDASLRCFLIRNFFSRPAFDTLIHARARALSLSHPHTHTHTHTNTHTQTDNMYIYTNIHIHVHIYVYIYI